jgi:hypothetical protein
MYAVSKAILDTIFGQFASALIKAGQATVQEASWPFPSCQRKTLTSLVSYRWSTRPVALVNVQVNRHWGGTVRCRFVVSTTCLFDLLSQFTAKDWSDHTHILRMVQKPPEVNPWSKKQNINKNLGLTTKREIEREREKDGLTLHMILPMALEASTFDTSSQTCDDVYL